MKVRLCVDPTAADVGTYTGSVVVTDPRFDTISVPATVRLQSTKTTWTAIVPPFLTIVAILFAVASIEARGPSEAFWSRYRTRLFGTQSFLALLPTLGAAYAAWVAQVANNPTWGADGLLSIGAFWLIGATAVTTATAILTTAAAGGS